MTSPKQIDLEQALSDKAALDRSQEGHRDGATYEPDKDYARLNKQAQAVFDLMKDGYSWWTLEALAKKTGFPEASISARLRDFRKERFGGHKVYRKRFGPSQFYYRLEVNECPSQTRK